MADQSLPQAAAEGASASSDNLESTFNDNPSSPSQANPATPDPIDESTQPEPFEPQPFEPQPFEPLINEPLGGERDIDVDLAPADTTMTDPPLPEPSIPVVAPLETSSIPQKKDASLRQFLSKMDDYAPLIPDAVTDYYLTLAGLPPPPQTDRRLARLLALATQKFIADIAADAYQYSRIRSTNTTSNNPMGGLGGAAGFGAGGDGGGAEAAGSKPGAGAGKKDPAGAGGKTAPLGGPRAGYGGGGAGVGQGQRTVLTMEDLGMAVGEYGVNVKRGEFYR